MIMPYLEIDKYYYDVVPCPICNSDPQYDCICCQGKGELLQIRLDIVHGSCFHAKDSTKNKKHNLLDEPFPRED
ncbi:hypothetical protein J6TS7_51710 [Paenibacillus dendritiformis]|nr:hypothetical protein J6TS7_51710 [Paenibacillus dendritiformis]